MQDFRLSPRQWRGVQTSGMLCGVLWQLVTNQRTTTSQKDDDLTFVTIKEATYNEYPLNILYTSK
jgi:hypothetical protein